MNAFESLSVVATESMQHQSFAEVLRTFSVLFQRLSQDKQARAEDLIRRILSGLGDQILPDPDPPVGGGAFRAGDGAHGRWATRDGVRGPNRAGHPGALRRKGQLAGDTAGAGQGGRIKRFVPECADQNKGAPLPKRPDHLPVTSSPSSSSSSPHSSRRQTLWVRACVPYTGRFRSPRHSDPSRRSSSRCPRM